MKRKPRILLFTGPGKGKTTAALGMALRAGGHGLRTLIVQFVKSDASTGELKALRRLPGVEIEQHGRGFVPAPGSKQLAAHREAAERALARAAGAMRSRDYDLVILDEVCFAVARKLVSEKAVLDALGRARAGSIVVMTGRGATKGLKAVADTVTEMRCVKHGYQRGILAQKGVEW